MTTKTRAQYIETEWECWTYDVWGNARDGYEVNDRSCFNRHARIRLKVETHNQGTEHEFQSAHPSEKQIRQIFGLTPFKLDTDGDDMTVYINRARDGYPIGEMSCLSHKSLSPIREADHA